MEGIRRISLNYLSLWGVFGEGRGLGRNRYISLGLNCGLISCQRTVQFAALQNWTKVSELLSLGELHKQTSFHACDGPLRPLRLYLDAIVIFHQRTSCNFWLYICTAIQKINSTRLNFLMVSVSDDKSLMRNN